MRPPGPDRSTSMSRLGAAASVIQSALFVVIGISALALGVDGLIGEGFVSLSVADPTAFRVLCIAFILIATLGLAITPAERSLIERADAGLAGFGAALAYLGHAGTIAFFTWWLLTSYDVPSGIDLDAVAPIEWGVMFELAFVGGWVWIIARLMRADRSAPSGFLMLSVVKATAFWFTFAAFLAMEKWMLVVGLGAVTFFAGPAWHLWIARILLRQEGEQSSGGEPVHVR